MIQCWIVTPREEMTYKLAVYKKLTAGVLALQRAELQKIRVEIARERLELLRKKRANKSPSSSPSPVSASTDTAPAESAPSGDPSLRSPVSDLRSPPPAPAPAPPPSTQQAEPSIPRNATVPPASPDIASPPANAPDSEQSHSASSHSSFELRHSPSPAPPAPATQPTACAEPSTRAAAVPPAYFKHGLKPLLIHGIPVVGFDGKQVMTRNGVRVGSSFRQPPQPAPGTATQASSRVPMGPPLSKIPPYRAIPPRPAPKP